MAESRITEIKKLLASDIEDVYMALGQEIDQGRIKGFPALPQAIIKHAKAWLDEKRVDLAAIVCPNEKIRVAIRTLDSEKGGTRVMLVAAIADVISAALTGISAITVAVLLVREGLDSLCPEF